jgi:hypothetical protein
MLYYLGSGYCTQAAAVQITAKPANMLICPLSNESTLMILGNNMMYSISTTHARKK